MNAPPELFDLVVRELRKLQGDECAICGDVFRLVVDHDHGSGMVRGLLCESCNKREGSHGACQAIGCLTCMYREHPPVTWLGFTCRYQSAFGSAGADVLRRGVEYQPMSRIDSPFRRLVRIPAAAAERVFGPVPESIGGAS